MEGLRYRDALKNVSFELRKGEILGIGGLAGQGQHELLLALAGCYPGVDCLAEADGKKVRLNRPANAIGTASSWCRATGSSKACS